ncbi:MAG: hypothetical protein LBV74_08405 [Tannerella sp.]|jgi:hypothetical protein|nr:hypothetical protein [Tannerella sp.]
MNREAEDIKVIRQMMEKSSKFLSFNGISIVFAGFFAIVGAVFAYFSIEGSFGKEYNTTQKMMILLADAMIVFVLSTCTITFFCWKKARSNNESLFSSTTRRAAYSLLLPLFAGGIFSLVFLFRGEVDIVCAATLIFYGLGLVNASKYTFPELNYLGIIEVILGVLALFFTGFSLYFWAIGFGICHIIFGFIMYFKYETSKMQ